MYESRSDSTWKLKGEKSATWNQKHIKSASTHTVYLHSTVHKNDSCLTEITLLTDERDSWDSSSQSGLTCEQINTQKAQRNQSILFDRKRSRKLMARLNKTKIKTGSWSLNTFYLVRDTYFKIWQTHFPLFKAYAHDFKFNPFYFDIHSLSHCKEQMCRIIKKKTKQVKRFLSIEMKLLKWNNTFKVTPKEN